MYWVRFFFETRLWLLVLYEGVDGRLYISYFDTSVSLEYSTEGAGV